MSGRSDDSGPLGPKRERVVEALTRGFADSVLDLAEFERRVDVAQRAESAQELDALLSGLQAQPEAQALVPVQPLAMVPADGVPRTRSIVAILSGARRRGQWTVPRRLNVVSILGGVDLDFREARLGPGVTEVNIVSVMGGASLLVPPWLPVEVEGIGILGAWEDHGPGSLGAEGTGVPMLRVRGIALMGGVEVMERLPGESARDARRRRRKESKELPRHERRLRRWGVRSWHGSREPAELTRAGASSGHRLEAYEPRRDLAQELATHRESPEPAGVRGVPSGAALPVQPSAGVAPAATSSPSDSRSAHAPTEHSLFPTLPAGSTFAGRYEIIGLLGRGGMGTVYRARDRQLDGDVAIKIANLELSANAELLERLKREAAAGHRISHDNVIRVHDLGEWAGRLYITMEHFDGEPLSALVLREGPVPPERVKGILSQVAAALGAAHRAGVVHRDVKPQNILLNAQGRVKVIDFGLAFTPHLQGLTATGVIMGTPEYMAPEQIRGEPVDTRTDLYGLGCVLYFLLTATPPFRADTPIAVGFAHLRKEHVPPSRLRTGINPAWDVLCARLLSKEREGRFGSADEVTAALQALP